MSIFSKIITPKEKAQELVGVFSKILGGDFTRNFPLTKQITLVCVDEIYEVLQHNHELPFDEYGTSEYWDNVEKEIKKLP